MKEYPSIQGPSNAPRQPCYGFVKYDGSNCRAEWNKKQGWYKFGTRTQLIDHNHPIFGRAVPTFLTKYGDDLEAVFKKEKHFRGVRNVIVFFEYFGAKSFAGMHFPDDDKWNAVLFDVNPITKGFLSPKEFVDHFGHLSVAELIWQGNMGEQLIQNVRKETMPEGISLESKYEIKTEIPEGIIIKGGSSHKLWMAKIKTERYKEALKQRYRMDWEKYWED